jgi:hypothetical protein
MYVVCAVTNGVMLIPSFVKICQLINTQTNTWTDKKVDTHTVAQSNNFSYTRIFKFIKILKFQIRDAYSSFDRIKVIYKSIWLCVEGNVCVIKLVFA